MINGFKQQYRFFEDLGAGLKEIIYDKLNRGEAEGTKIARAFVDKLNKSHRFKS